MSQMLKDLLGLSHVPRWVTHPVTRPQTVAEHSFRVAIIAKVMADILNLSEDIRSSIIMWALIHDAAESKTGDLPSPAKQIIGREAWDKLEREACPWLETPGGDTVVHRVVELADTAEALSWITNYGNGLRDKFDEESIESKLRKRLYDKARGFGPEYTAALYQIMGSITP